MKSNHKLITFAQIGIILFIIWLVLDYLQSASVDTEQHHKRVTLLLEAKTLDAQIDQFALQILAADLRQYDELVVLSQQLNQLKIEVTNTVPSPFADTNHNIEQNLSKLILLLDQKMQLMERIKTSASLIRNAILYLPQLSKELKAQKSADALLAYELLSQVISYSFYADHSKYVEISHSLTILQQTQHNPLLDNLSKHLTVHLEQQNQLLDLKNEFIAITSKQTFENLNAAYNQYHQKQLRKAKQANQNALLLCSILLVILMVLFRHFIQARKEAIKSSRLLQAALSSIQEGFALFDKQNSLILSNQAWTEHQGDAQSPLKKSTQSETQTLALTAQKRWIKTTQRTSSNGNMVCVSVDVTDFKEAEMTLLKWGHAIEQSPVSIVITDTMGRIEYVNPKFEQVTGYYLEEVQGKSPRMLRSRSSAINYRKLWQTICEGDEWQGEFYNKKKNGELYWEHARISAIKDEHGLITHFMAVKEDITEQKLAHAQLKTAAAVFGATQEGIMTTDARLNITAVNPAFTKITGYSADEVLGQSPSLLSSGKHDSHFYESMWQTLKTQGQWASEIWNKRKNGTIYPEWLSISVLKDENDNVQQYIAVLSDITERKSQQQKIQYQAYYDALTGLPNRSLLMERISQSLLQSERHKQISALLFIDLDRFKRINDTMGHEAGDLLLKEVAARLQQIVRKSDTVSRFGGDEFVVLLSNISCVEHSAVVANKILETLCQPFDINNFEVFSGASIGITLLPNDANSAKELLRLADLAMYKAKESGRNQYHFFAKSMQKQVNRRVELEHKLRHAIKTGELQLYYQPILDSNNSSLYGVEALMRWPQIDGSFISPAEFIPVAEESGLIKQMGEWLIKQACDDIAAFNLACDSNTVLSVNVSSQQYRLGFNAHVLESILDNTHFTACNLNLEITESILLDDDNAVMTWLKNLRATGAKLSIDDFGTGYSSLSYLRRFPINTLKIDRSFIADLGQSSDASVLVEAILSMAKSLHLKVIAEGVETNEQLMSLNALGGHLVQGYFYAKPMPICQLHKWVRESHFLKKPNHSIALDYL